MRRISAALFSIVMAAAVISPLFRSPPRDSFPLSNYPMFSGRLEAVNDVRTAVGRTGDGERLLLSPREISGSDEVMQALSDVSRAVSRGDAAVEALCAAIAVRVGDDRVVLVEVVTEKYDTVDYFSGADRALSVVVHATCRVPR